MCFRDVIDSLHAQGISVTPTQIRWAIDSGKVSRPRVDGSLRFDFAEQHLNQLRIYFGAKAEREKCKQNTTSATAKQTK